LNGINEGEQEGNPMTSPRRFGNLLATVLAGALAATPLAATAQQQWPAPQPDQYGTQPDQYGTQSAPPDAVMQYGAPQGQYDAPQGIEQAPPAIPDYQQPEAPGDGYIWTPGYWAWTGDGYEWVDGAWVLPPYTGALWTPGYWGYAPYGYFWNAGYWGPYVGYYGGINYGFGYFGVGFYGGYWGGGHFWYNRAYCNVGFHNGYVYSHPYNGYSGRPGGTSFVHGTAIAANQGYGSTAFRGSTVNGRPSSFAQSASRPGYSNPAYNGAVRSYTGAYNGNNYAAHSYSPPTNYSSGYSAPRSFSAPSGGYSGGYHGAAPISGGGGGGYHGGGGFQGGGGGGGFHGGGGGGHR
jgi:hypothetical protein